MTDKTNLLDLDPEGLRSYFAGLGEKPFRATQVLKWVHQVGTADFDAMTNLSKALRARLPGLAAIEAPVVASDQDSEDGTRKWLLRLDGGNAIEAVFIPEGGETAAQNDGPSDPDARSAAAIAGADSAGRSRFGGRAAGAPRRYRGTLCVSSQVGCTLNCSFCSTGHQGFNRNLTTAEIVGQLWLASRALGRGPDGNRRITNVVLMGMGEPLLNFENVVRALRVMLDDNAYGLSRRRVTLSTAGLVPMIDRLREVCPVSLAVSLHAPTDELRNELVPLNRKYPIGALLDACRRYVADQPHRRITFEYVMLDGVNDSVEHAEALVRLLADVPSKVNLIPFNPFPHTRYRRSAPRAIARFAEVLWRAGLTTVTRKTRGDDIDAACGQLAGQVNDRTRRQRRLGLGVNA